MPRYKLHYFNVRARAESIRILLTLAGADWEDTRIYDKEKEWEPMKESGKCPFGQLPILEVDGTVLGQSTAILRYLAKEHGLAPEKNLQQAIADGIVDQIQDIALKILKMWFEKDVASKEEQTKNINEKILPENMENFENILKQNGQGKTFFFGDKITYADIHFFDFVNSVIGGGKPEVPEVLKNFPNLTKLYNGVMNEPSILAYLKKRPETEH